MCVHFAHTLDLPLLGALYALCSSFQFLICDSQIPHFKHILSMKIISPCLYENFTLKERGKGWDFFFSLLIILGLNRKKKKKSIPDSHAYVPEVSVYVFFLLINMIIPCGSDKPSSLSALLLFSHSVVSNSFVTSWTAVHQASLSMGFARQEYWSGQPFSPPLSTLVNLKIWQRMRYLGIQRIFEERTKCI